VCLIRWIGNHQSLSKPAVTNQPFHWNGKDGEIKKQQLHAQQKEKELQIGECNLHKSEEETRLRERKDGFYKTMYSTLYMLCYTSLWLELRMFAFRAV